MRQPVFYLTHGGGPCFWMEFGPPIGPHGFDGLGTYLSGLADGLPAPARAYLVISAHWEAAAVTLATSPRPGMLYDYSGFPPHTYQLQHPAPGAPELAVQVRTLLRHAGIATEEDANRGLDHGVFVPMKLIDPTASTPILVVSLRSDLDPAFHLDLGRALAPLRDEGVVILGSGSSFHNLRTYFDGRPSADADAFDAWLTETATTSEPDDRARRLINWAAAPGARSCHPREEHLLPLMVAAGAALDGAGVRDFHDRIAGKPFSGYRWG